MFLQHFQTSIARSAIAHSFFYYDDVTLSQKSSELASASLLSLVGHIKLAVG